MTRRVTMRERLLRARAVIAVRAGGETLMLGLAVVVGLVTGLLAVALLLSVQWIQNLAFEHTAPTAALLTVPLLGGLIVGLIAQRAPEVAGGGVTQVMRAIALHSGRMRAAVAPLKLVASAVSLGTGASGGREGPIVQIGGGAASVMGRVFALDDEAMRTLIAAGAGAGIAASFNAPLAGIFFAIEIIIGGYRVRSLQTVVVTCVVASVTARELVGSQITYRLIDPPVFRDPRELLLYALLGLAAAGVGLAFSRGEHLVATATHRLQLWAPLKPAMGAFGVGLIALAVPEVIGSGDHLPASLTTVTEPVEALLNGNAGAGYAAVLAALALLVAKLVATCLAAGSGSSVGSFAPALFLGTALGAAFGLFGQEIFPSELIDPKGFALVGGAAVLAAATHAPLTGILLAFELTNDYAMVLPLMLATGIALLVSEHVDRDSLYTRPLREAGIIYAEPQDLDLMQTVTVGEVMTQNPHSVPASMPLADLLDEFAKTGHHGFPVIIPSDDGPRLFGIVTLADLARPDSGGLENGEMTAGTLATRPCVTVTPSDPVFRALRRMAAIDVGRLPVVSDDDHAQLVGLFRRADLVAAYQRAITRTLGSQQRQATGRLRDLAGVAYVELTVSATGKAAGRAIRDIEWPGRTVVTSIRRGQDVIMPTGETVFEAGDEVVALTAHGATAALQDLLSEPAGTKTAKPDP